MKMKIVNNLIIAVAMTVSLASCEKSFVDIQPKGQFLSANYYADKDQAYAALVAVYDVMRKNSGGFENMITMMNAGSDDQVAGGGGASDGAGIQGFSNYTLNAIIMPASFWNDYYQGIFRANILLQKVSGVNMDDALKNRFTAEAKALRAFYYFNLEIMFKNIPLLLEPLTATNMYDVTQATPADVYAQIEKDLTEAIANLPATVPAATEAGRFTKGAAQALLGKVYLYDKKNALAAAQLAEVNGTPGATSQYGYRLLSNFADLWVTSNKFNSESILEVCHSSIGSSGWGNWGSGSDEGNSVNVMVGPRSYSRPAGSTAPDLPSGWSFNVFTQDFYDAIKSDPRFAATVFDLNALKAAGQADYIAGYQNSGYFLNKFLPRQSDVSTGSGDQVLN